MSKKDFVKLAEVVKRAYGRSASPATEQAISMLEQDLTYMLQEDNALFDGQKWSEYIGRSTLIEE